MWGAEWPKNEEGYIRKQVLWTITSNSLTENEEHDIPSQMTRLFFRPQYVWWLTHLQGPVIPDPNGQLAEIIVYIIPPE